MKHSILTLFLSLIIGTTLAHGAVITVPSESDLNSSISGATSGDTLVLMGGFYGDIVISGKVLHFERSQVVPQISSISFLNAEGLCSITDLKIDGNVELSNGSLSIVDSIITGSLDLNNSISSELNIRRSKIDGNVIVFNSRNSNVKILDSNITGNARIYKSNLFVKKSKINGNLRNSYSVDDNGGSLSSTILQSEIREYLFLESSKSKILYNLIRYSYFEGKAEIIGNEFNGRVSDVCGITITGANTRAVIKNNRIHNYSKSNSHNITEKNIGIFILDNARAEITNNLLHDIKDLSQSGAENYSCLGIYVKSTLGTKIMGNIFHTIGTVYPPAFPTSSRAILAPYKDVISQNNCFYTFSALMNDTPLHGGVIDYGSINIDPNLNPDFTLQSNSPAINAGPSDPQYNDRDGSRNDIGMFGGHNFIPDGRTTDKPIVLGLDVAPIAVPTGGTVTIESTGATVK